MENWEEKHSHNRRHPHFPFPINQSQSGDCAQRAAALNAAAFNVQDHPVAI